MRTHRFGRKIKLPATIAIKHRIRMRMAQYEIRKAEVEATQEAFKIPTGPQEGEPLIQVRIYNIILQAALRKSFREALPALLQLLPS